MKRRKIALTKMQVASAFIKAVRRSTDPSCATSGGCAGEWKPGSGCVPCKSPSITSHGEGAVFHLPGASGVCAKRNRRNWKWKPQAGWDRDRRCPETRSWRLHHQVSAVHGLIEFWFRRFLSSYTPNAPGRPKTTPSTPEVTGGDLQGPQPCPGFHPPAHSAEVAQDGFVDLFASLMNAYTTCSFATAIFFLFISE